MYVSIGFMYAHIGSSAKGCFQSLSCFPKSTYTGSTLRPKYILFGYMAPEGLIVRHSLVEIVPQPSG